MVECILYTEYKTMDYETDTKTSFVRTEKVWAEADAHEMYREVENERDFCKGAG